MTVTAAIASRLDALPPSVPAAALFSAAVVGRTFWRGVAAALSGDQPVDDALDELERRDLVRREHLSRLEGDVEYRFRHALIRDVAYATLPRAERAARHRDVARYIEERAAADTRSIAWILGHHGRAAGEPARAVPHLLTAAAVAERGWATREVVELYSLALDLATDAEARAAIRLPRGMALKALDEDHEAAAALRGRPAGASWSRAARRPCYECRALVWSERHEEALERGHEALELADTLVLPACPAPPLALVSNALGMRGDEGDLEWAVALGDDALALWRPDVRGYEHADHLHLQADVKYWTGDYPGSLECGVRAREIAGDVHSAHALLRGGGIEAMARVGLGEHEAPPAKLDAIVEIARELRGSCAHLPNYQSVIHREVFDLEAARDASEAALEASRNPAFRMPHRFALADLLQTALLAGDVGRAQAGLARALAGRLDGDGRMPRLARPWPTPPRPGGDRCGGRRPEAAADWATRAVEVTAQNAAGEVRGAGAFAARPRPRGTRTRRRGPRGAAARGRDLRPARQPARALARAGRARSWARGRPVTRRPATEPRRRPGRSSSVSRRRSRRSAPPRSSRRLPSGSSSTRVSDFGRTPGSPPPSVPDFSVRDTGSAPRAT